MSACAAPAMLVASARYRTAGSLPDQRNLQVGGAVLFRIEAAAVDIARTPEQQIAPKIDEVVFHEIRPFLETESLRESIYLQDVDPRIQLLSAMNRFSNREWSILEQPRPGLRSLEYRQINALR
jgi:hypothetical protein